MLKGINPYLPWYEYVPDGEPHVFGDRVYVYGSHDRFMGYAFCQNDYVCYSASVDDLTEWQYEGVIYTRTEAPRNEDGAHCLYAPDVTQGPDGRYYLYYALDGIPIISVAVCDTPAGKYQYYGDVCHADGTILGLKEGDDFQFDPGVNTEGDVTWLYSGFCPPMMTDRLGAQAIALDKDMITIIREPKIIVPSSIQAKGTSFEGHGFFEASSMRQVNGKYYFIYSSELSHELCYAVSDRPDEGFVYGGTIIDNGDLGIVDTPRYFVGNNHGSIERINGRWYIFYHRHTNASMYSRQGMIEPIAIDSAGNISQVEMTSTGPSGGAIQAQNIIPAYCACNIYMTRPPMVDGAAGHNPFPYITQDVADVDAEELSQNANASGLKQVDNDTRAYIRNITPGVVVGFKYLDFQNVTKLRVKTRGMCYGGKFDIMIDRDDNVVDSIDVAGGNEWTTSEASVQIPDGVHSLYFKMDGYGTLSFLDFEFC